MERELSRLRLQAGGGHHDVARRRQFEQIGGQRPWRGHVHHQFVPTPPQECRAEERDEE